jgi:hypothetical protein
MNATAPTELSGPRPRDVRLTAGGRFVYGVAIVLFAASIAAVVLLSRLANVQAADRDALMRDSVVTRAQVTRLWKKSGESSRTMVAYAFDVNGQPHDGQARISTARWRRLQVGATLDIRYRPDNPDTTMVEGFEPSVLPRFVPFLLGVLAAMAGTLVLYGLNCQRRLLSEGRAAQAVVTEVRKHHTTHGGSYRTVNYTFQLMSGAMRSGKSEAPRKPPAIGSTVWIVYDPDRPRRSRLYPFPLVKTARL